MIEPGGVYRAGPHLLACGDLAAGHFDELLLGRWNGAAKAKERAAESARSAAAVYVRLPRVPTAPDADLLRAVARATRAARRLSAVEVPRGGELVLSDGGERVTLSGGRTLYLGARGADRGRAWRVANELRRNAGAATVVALVVALGTRRGEWVADPILGSAETLFAVNGLGRRCLGMEPDPDRLAAALDRVGLEPTKEGELDG